MLLQINVRAFKYRHVQFIQFRTHCMWIHSFQLFKVAHFHWVKPRQKHSLQPNLSDETLRRGLLKIGLSVFCPPAIHCQMKKYQIETVGWVHSSNHMRLKQICTVPKSLMRTELNNWYFHNTHIIVHDDESCDID